MRENPRRHVLRVGVDVDEDPSPEPALVHEAGDGLPILVQRDRDEDHLNPDLPEQGFGGLRQLVTGSLDQLRLYFAALAKDLLVDVLDHRLPSFKRGPLADGLRRLDGCQLHRLQHHAVLLGILFGLLLVGGHVLKRFSHPGVACYLVIGQITLAVVGGLDDRVKGGDVIFDAGLSFHLGCGREEGTVVKRLQRTDDHRSVPGHPPVLLL